MKKLRFFSILLMLVMLCNSAMAGGSGGSGFVFPRTLTPNPYDITSQAWYTKLIDLTGYKGKNVSGTLHFDLVPDTTASGDETYTLEYTSPFGGNTKVEVTAVKHPGFEKYSYDVPFSSEDFVDEKFTNLCRTVNTDFGFEGQTQPPPKMPAFSSNTFMPARAPSQNGDSPKDLFHRTPYNEENMLKYIELYNHAFLY